MNKEIKIEINYQRDREDIVRALVNAGYKVWVEEDETSDYPRTRYYVLFELKEL